MKILVLMPCDEQHVYAAAGILKALPHEVRDITFAIPTFMDYLINGKIVGNWIMALFDSLVSAKQIYNAAVENNDDIIIIGNVSTECKFDFVFNFQEIEEALPYQDNFIDKVKELVSSEQLLTAALNCLHGAEKSSLALKDCIATADFLTDIIKSDEQIKKVEKDFKSKLKRKEVM